MTNVLLAIDGPVYGKVILDFVANHQWVPGTNFKIIHSIELPSGIDAWPEGRFDGKELKTTKDLLTEMTAKLEKSLPKANVSYSICYGSPKEQILNEATTWPAHMIVMGSHGRPGLQHFLLGSVSLSVMMHAHCSTIIVRVPKEELAKYEIERQLTQSKTVSG